MGGSGKEVERREGKEGIGVQLGRGKTKTTENIESSRTREDRHSIILRITYGIFQ